MQEKHKETKNYKEKKETKKKRKQRRKLITKEERTKERRKRITRWEFPRLRPVEYRSTKRSKQLVSGAIQVLKSPPIMLLPQTPQ